MDRTRFWQLLADDLVTLGEALQLLRLELLYRRADV
jgi:hypothetical protein